MQTTWHKSMHSLMLSTWNLSDGKKSSQSWDQVEISEQNSQPLNWQKTPFNFESFHNKNWDPRWCVCTGAFPILWVARCQLARTEVDQENQQSKNHLGEKKSSLKLLSVKKASKTRATWKTKQLETAFKNLKHLLFQGHSARHCVSQPHSQALISDNSV